MSNFAVQLRFQHMETVQWELSISLNLKAVMINIKWLIDKFNKYDFSQAPVHSLYIYNRRLNDCGTVLLGPVVINFLRQTPPFHGLERKEVSVE